MFESLMAHQTKIKQKPQKCYYLGGCYLKNFTGFLSIVGVKLQNEIYAVEQTTAFFNNCVKSV